MRVLFKGGTVISGSGAKRADVLTDGEKILKVGRELKCSADVTEDVSGCLLFPGPPSGFFRRLSEHRPALHRSRKPQYRL